jgi:hypothetical protein
VAKTSALLMIPSLLALPLVPGQPYVSRVFIASHLHEPAPAGQPSRPPAPKDTWTGFARDFMARYCVRCHNDDMTGDVWRNYRLLSSVAAEKVVIGCGLAKSSAVRDLRGCPSSAPPARQFPVGDGPKPTDAERERMLSWIDGDMP